MKLNNFPQNKLILMFTGQTQKELCKNPRNAEKITLMNLTFDHGMKVQFMNIKRLVWIRQINDIF